PERPHRHHLAAARRRHAVAAPRAAPALPGGEARGASRAAQWPARPQPGELLVVHTGARAVHEDDLQSGHLLGLPVLRPPAPRAGGARAGPHASRDDPPRPTVVPVLERAPTALDDQPGAADDLGRGCRRAQPPSAARAGAHRRAVTEAATTGCLAEP